MPKRNRPNITPCTCGVGDEDVDFRFVEFKECQYCAKLLNQFSEVALVPDVSRLGTRFIDRRHVSHRLVCKTCYSGWQLAWMKRSLNGTREIKDQNPFDPWRRQRAKRQHQQE